MANKLPVLIASLCAEAGLKKVFLSPGARSAPLVRAFHELGCFDLSVVNDERAAAFIALGWVKGAGQPAILLCTSGSAVLNYAPAVAEADGSDLPLLLISADRPREYLGQFEGQTTRQDYIFRVWTRSCVVLEDADSELRPAWCLRILNTALDALWEVPSGPVHINVHLNEPLFENPQLPPPTGLRIFKQQPPRSTQFLSRAIADLSENHSRILALAGARLGPAPAKRPILVHLLQNLGVPVLAEPSAFGVAEKDILTNAEDILRCLPEDRWHTLAPEVLITMGGNIVGKKIKRLLQRFRPSRHIHLDPAGRRVDMFGCLSEVWALDPADDSLDQIEVNFTKSIKPDQGAYLKLWHQASEKAQQRCRQVTEALPFGDFKAVDFLLRFLPEDGLLHVGNSMPLRYFLNASAQLPEGLRVDVNRGVSGIDGTLGTAVGLALAQPDMTVFCLLGDIAFHHGLNALWLKQVPPNLKIILLNNSGGNIFGIISDPATVPQASVYFENRAPSTAQWDARKFGLHYFSASDMEALRQNFLLFLNVSGPAILEIFTDPDVNISAYKQFEQQMSSNL